jgi:hypothetical protein
MLGLFLHIASQRIPGPQIRIHCPWCGGRGVTAQTFDQREGFGLIIPSPEDSVTTTFAKCDACRRIMLAKVPAAELAGLSPEELEHLLAKRVSPVLKVLTILGLVLFWAPFLGLSLAVVALLWSLRTGGWTRTASVIATVLSATMTATVIVILCTE